MDEVKLKQAQKDLAHFYTAFLVKVAERDITGALQRGIDVQRSMEEVVKALTGKEF